MTYWHGQCQAIPLILLVSGRASVMSGAGSNYRDNPRALYPHDGNSPAQRRVAPPSSEIERRRVCHGGGRQLTSARGSG